MLGCFYKPREKIAEIIRKSPKTEDGYYICNKFSDLNKKIGEHYDKNYIFPRESFENKICFTENDINAYLEKQIKNYDISSMKRRDNYLYDIIKDDVKKYKLNEIIQGNCFTLGELIDNSLFIFYNKYC